VINQLLAPDEIGTDTGHRVFYVEEQGVWVWGIAEGGRPLSVWISAVSDEAITFLEPHLSDAWDYYSPHDGSDL
jgi:hypothetical protein